VTEPDSAPASEVPPENDELEWDSARFGPLADYATPDDEVVTVSSDDYLADQSRPLAQEA
jgi:hypothetical protein